MSDTKTHARDAEREAGIQRAIQKKIDASDQAKGNKPEPKPMQAGSRLYPELPFPEQHQTKSGSEASLVPEPMYDNPHYNGSDKLKDMVALISGGDSPDRWQHC